MADLGFARELSHIQAALAIDDVQLGVLFGVDASAISQWRATGLPSEREAGVTDLLATVELLERSLETGALPRFAVSPSEGDGETLLQRLSRDPAEARATYGAAFDLSTGA